MNELEDQLIEIESNGVLLEELKSNENGKSRSKQSENVSYEINAVEKLSS